MKTIKHGLVGFTEFEPNGLTRVFEVEGNISLFDAMNHKEIPQINSKLKGVNGVYCIARNGQYKINGKIEIKCHFAIKHP